MDESGRTMYSVEKWRQGGCCADALHSAKLDDGRVGFHPPFVCIKSLLNPFQDSGHNVGGPNDEAVECLQHAVAKGENEKTDSAFQVAE